jgi:hypothetical protein
MQDKVIVLKISKELAELIDILPHKLGTGGIKQTITQLASMFVLDSLSYSSPVIRKRVCKDSRASQKDTETLPVSMKGNEPAKAVFIRAKRKLEILCGREFKDTEVIRALLILAKENFF